jgi:hypothetical protein
MVKRSVIVFSVLAMIPVAVEMFADTPDAVSAWRGCDGTVVLRTSAGKLEVTKQAPNLPGCVGTRVADTGAEVIVTPVVPVVSTQPVGVPPSSIVSSGTLVVQEVEEVHPSIGGLVRTPVTKKYNPSSGPLLDLASTDIVNYRKEQLKQEQIRYANALRSVRMRQKAAKESKTVAYLMKNDTVVIQGKETGWVKTTGVTVQVTDTRENTVGADTTGKASGYMASKYLRTPTSSDLVRIGQADQAYWSDVSHVNVAHLVNVRLHPWYGAPIVNVLSNKTNLYVISTVDNWSEVISDDRSIHGFIRSDYLIVDKAQRVEPSPFL